ncbi:MAG TPA: hypothetical protein PKJ97_01740 [Candidatus Bilamarchaeaceae archaeon]|nr:hypothetical protein [Candidatus Bilamarchaeaceae archaeon]
MDGENPSLILMYRDRSGRETGLPVPLPAAAGSQLGTFIGPERTVIFTQNAILLVQGYNSCFRGELFIPMEDGEPPSSTLMVPLPGDSSGGNLLSFTRSSGVNGDFAYFLSASGNVRSRETRLVSSGFSEASIPIDSGTRLAQANGYAVAYAPGSNMAHVLLGTGTTEMLMEAIALQEPISSPPVAIPAGDAILLTLGSQTFLVSKPLPGQPGLSVVPLS